jgi:hypothetical protein
MENIHFSVARTPAQKRLVAIIWKDGKVLWRESYSAGKYFPLEATVKQQDASACWKSPDKQIAWEANAYVDGGGTFLLWVMYDKEDGRVSTQVQFSEFGRYSV